MTSKFAAMGRVISFDSPQVLHLRHPVTDLPIMGLDEKGEKTIPCTITLLSDDSVVAKKFEREMLDRRLARKNKPTADDLIEENRLKAAKQTQAWKLFAPDTGEELDLECNEANALELYQSMEWVYEQVIEFKSNRGNYKTT